MKFAIALVAGIFLVALAAALMPSLGLSLLLLLGVVVVVGAAAVVTLALRPSTLPALATILFWVSGVSIVFGALGAIGNTASTLLDDRPRITYHGSIDRGEISVAFTDVDTGAGTDPLREARASGAAFTENARAVASVGRTTLPQRALWVVQELLPWALAIAGLLLARPVLAAAGSGDPFHPQVARRVRWLGVLLLLGVPLVLAVRSALAIVVTNSMHSTPPVPQPDFAVSYVPFLPGIVVLVLASVFQRGAELRELERATV